MLKSNKENTSLYIKYINTGDIDYFKKLYDNIYPYSINMVRKYLHKKYFAEDLVNEAIESIIDKKHQFDTNRKFNNWYLVILFNLINQRNNKEKRYDFYFDITDDWKSDIFITQEGEDRLLYHWKYENKTEDPSVFKDEVDKVNRLKEELVKRFSQYIPEDVREIVKCRYYYGEKRRHLIEDYNEFDYNRAYYHVNSSGSKTLKTMKENLQNEIDFVERELNIYWNN